MKARLVIVLTALVAISSVTGPSALAAVREIRVPQVAVTRTEEAKVLASATYDAVSLDGG